MFSLSYPLKFFLKREVNALAQPVSPEGQPNLNEMARIANSVRVMELNIKAFGYDLARRAQEALPVRTDLTARQVGLASKASTQADIESDWCAYWANELRAGVVYHRKLWELTYVAQAVYEYGFMRPGARGLGFGCGLEPFPSYFAAQGIAVTVTDLEIEAARAKGWVESSQHAKSLDQAFHAHLVDRETFDRQVEFRVADMNDIPADLTGYDFCWSMCAVEHLGSIKQGLDFIEASLKTLNPGGLSVHTMEYNCEPEGPTVDNWPTVLFQRRHLEALADRLRAQGHEVAAFDFNLGHQPLDHFIDVPPYYMGTGDTAVAALGHPLHIKLVLDGFVATCFGIIVRKAA
ncbi:MAG: methyltransferase domain-containing protein [Sphingomonas sp.]|nr:methyltransferase domain-containing protein [Sphingomonas sp.]